MDSDPVSKRKYKRWKSDNTKPIPVKTVERWAKRREMSTQSDCNNSDDGILSVNTDKVASKCSRMEIGQKIVQRIQHQASLTVQTAGCSSQKNYKLWKTDSTVPVHEKTYKRWKARSIALDNEVALTATTSTIDERIICDKLADNNDDHPVSETSDSTQNDDNCIMKNSSFERRREDSSTSSDQDSEINAQNRLSTCNRDSSAEEEETNNEIYTDNDGFNEECIENNSMRTDQANVRRIEHNLNDVRLYPGSEVRLDDTVLDLIRMYTEHGCTQSLLNYTLNMMVKTYPKNHNLPNTIYKLFQYVMNVAPRFSSTKHFYCKNVECVQYIGTQAKKCTSCSNDTVERFYEIHIDEQIENMFTYRDLANKLQLHKQRGRHSKQNYLCDIVDGSEYIRVHSRHGKQPYDLTLIMNTDGISLVKSAKSHCYPIMFMIAELPEYLRESFIIVGGIWFSKKVKPLMNTFLIPFCVKFHKYFHEGIIWKNPQTQEICTSKVVTPLIIADAPVRAQLLNMMNFNGRYGCNICEVQMKLCEPVEGKRAVRAYPFCEKKDIRLRNAKRMDVQAKKVLLNSKLEHVKGIKGLSIISTLPCLDISTCVIPEYMHSVLLGVGFQCINLFFGSNGPGNVRRFVSEIDEELLKIRPPHFFPRTPRSISANLNLLKANEIYNWILFYSCPIMKDYQEEKYFQHWILLVVSLFLLLQREIHIADLEKADILLKLFVRDFPILYGDRTSTYNVHQLLHLVLIVKRWGPLWATSAFPFENFNGVLGRITHGTKNIGQELLNNIQLMRGAEILSHKCNGRNRKTNQSTDRTEINHVNGNHRLRSSIVNDIENELLISQGLIDVNSKIYIRAIIHGEEYTSAAYKDTKCNSFTVMITKTDNTSTYGIIRFFYFFNDDLCFIVQHLSVHHSKFILQYDTEMKVDHIIPVKEENTFTCIKVKEIEKMCHVIRVANYICKRPNLLKKIM